MTASRQQDHPYSTSAHEHPEARLQRLAGEFSLARKCTSRPDGSVSKGNLADGSYRSLTLRGRWRRGRAVYLRNYPPNEGYVVSTLGQGRCLGAGAGFSTFTNYAAASGKSPYPSRGGIWNGLAGSGCPGRSAGRVTAKPRAIHYAIDFIQGGNYENQ